MGMNYSSVRLILLVLTAAVIVCESVDAAGRSSAQRAAFVRVNPCPVTGEGRGPCPGWVVDHIVPLCAGGPDEPGNMQWQRADEALKKDVVERRVCREMRRGQ